MKKISWITDECFLDVDLPIISQLQEKYYIFWQIVLTRGCDLNDCENYVNTILSEKDRKLIISYVVESNGHYDPRLLFTSYRTVKRAKSFCPDIYYLSGFMIPWGLLLYKLLLPIKKTIVALHNVTEMKGSGGLASKIGRLFVLKFFPNIQVFSKCQKSELYRLSPSKNVLCAPLALKNYGQPRKDENSNVIRFLYFGFIREYKRVDLLIDAANILFERGYKNFRVLIAGYCNDWNSNYASMIRHTEVFELDIRRIPNDEVADLFAKSKYFVMPYQEISQSGAITVAFQYNIPVISSDIPAFGEFVEDGKTGIMFKSECVTDLANKMQYVLDNHHKIYDSLKIEQAAFVSRELSLQSIVNKYECYFDNF